MADSEERQQEAQEREEDAGPDQSAMDSPAPQTPEPTREIAESLLARRETDAKSPPPHGAEEHSLRFQHIGPYRLIKRISHGGMGEIYLARKEGLEKDLALKVMLEMLEGFPDLRARFLRETQVLARAEHPNICPILDAGEHQGCPYYVMPFLSGLDLRQALKSQRITYARAADIARQVADALDFAHSQGIIHRDLKPENIILTRTSHPAVESEADQATSMFHGLKTRIARWMGRRQRSRGRAAAPSSGPEAAPTQATGAVAGPAPSDAPTLLKSPTEAAPEHGVRAALPSAPEQRSRAPAPEYRDHVYLMDFGLAADLSDETRLTRTSRAMGTPSYMAPEQARADRDQIGPWTDVYEIGAVLYELCTLRVPFPQGNLAELSIAIQYDDPLAPRRLRPDLPSDLEAVILKCVEKEPRRRYQTARQLREELDRFLAGGPVLASAPGPFDRLYRKAKRHGGAIGVAAGLLLLLAGTIIYFLSIQPGLERKRELEQDRVVLREALKTKMEHERALASRIDNLNTHVERGEWELALEEAGSLTGAAEELVGVKEELPDSLSHPGIVQDEGEFRGWKYHGSHMASSSLREFEQEKARRKLSRRSTLPAGKQASATISLLSAVAACRLVWKNPRRWRARLPSQQTLPLASTRTPGAELDRLRYR